MAVLVNITISVATLKTIRPDITRFQYRSEEGGTDFADEILRAKTTLYREVLDKERLLNPGMSEAGLSIRLANVKDLPDVTYLAERLNLRCLQYIMTANDQFDLADVYENDANNVGLIYYVDTDTDSVVDDDEKRRIKVPSFTR